MSALQVQILVGPIASGKSTYSRNAAKAGFVIINDDAIVQAVHGGDYQLYDTKLKPLYKSVENALASTALAMGKSVVVDRGTNNSVDSRKRWVGLAKSFDAFAVALVFPDEGAAVHAQRRAESDGRGHGLEYWYKVAAHHEFYRDEPTEDEVDELYRIDWSAIQSGVVYGQPITASGSVWSGSVGQG